MLRALGDPLVGARRAAIAAVNSSLASSTLSVSAALPVAVTASSAALTTGAPPTTASAPTAAAAVAASLRARICAERDADCLAGLVRAAGSLTVQDARTIDGASRAVSIRRG